MKSEKRKVSRKVYIQAAEQISIQSPLSEEWMNAPISYEEPLVKAVNPSFRDYLAPNEARRMGNLMKRALVTSLKVLKDTGIEHPDAIITGTCLGSLDYTVRILDDLVENGEETVSPTYFMQSTHNTVGSALGIYTKTHGYNTTYSHGGASFDSALLDAWMQFRLGKIKTALVGGYDEMVDSHFNLVRKVGYVGLEGMAPCSEVSMSMLLNADSPTDALCEMAGIRLCYRPSMEKLRKVLDELLDSAGISIADVSAVMTGVNGNPTNDKPYRDAIEHLFPHKPLLRYKHLFGENYTVSALGTYAAAHLLKKQEIPSIMYDRDSSPVGHEVSSILLLNMVESGDCSLILLKRI